MQKKLKVLGHNYKVKKTPTLEKFSEADARCYLRLQEIYVDTTMPESKQEEAFIHEIVEIINHHFVLELPHNKIDIIGEMIHCIFKDNKLLDLGKFI